MFCGIRKVTNNVDRVKPGQVSYLYFWFPLICIPHEPLYKPDFIEELFTTDNDTRRIVEGAEWIWKTNEYWSRTLWLALGTRCFGKSSSSGINLCCKIRRVKFRNSRFTSSPNLGSLTSDFTSDHLVFTQCTGGFKGKKVSCSRR